ncbi:MAG: hypothetical protein MSQ05_02005 [Akkermansia sp.]|nr:hypothetical protein [Akkermansia sp.]
MNTTVNNPEEGDVAKPDECPTAPPEVEKAPKKQWSFEELCDKLQRFSIRTAAWSAAGTLGIALLCGLVYLIAMWAN